MSKASADISGTTGTKFTFVIDAATIVSAFLDVRNQPEVPLTVSGNSREVAVPSLLAGQSFVRLDLIWAPGDEDAVIDIGTAPPGTVTAAKPKHTLDAGKTPGFVELWGE